MNLNVRANMEFEKYQHVEKFGHLETSGIEIGRCYIFPKIDGTNGTVWAGEATEEVRAGSRNREIDLHNDNQGFYEYIQKHEGIKNLLSKAYLRLFGEWLVPHTLKDYRDDAWRKFYVFDVMNHVGEYMPYEEYKPLLDMYGIDYISPLAVIENPMMGDFTKLLDTNGYLMKDGFIGEGIVIKNYQFRNKFGRVTWAKIVRNEFKDKHGKENKVQIIHRDNIEEKIANRYVDATMVDKIYANIVNTEGGWMSKFIPRLLHTAFYELVREDSWSFIKEHKNPVIDFNRLQQFTIIRVKQLKPELF